MKFGLRARSTVVGVAVFLIMSVITFFVIRYFSIGIAHDLGSEYARENAMRYAEKIKGTLEFDLTLTQKLSSNDAIMVWSEHEQEPLLRQKVFSLLNDYMEVSRAGSWFIAFEKSGHYYFNDANGSYTGSEYIKTLSAKNFNDQWFFHTLQSPDPYNLNIDYDEVLGLTKLWLNMPIVREGKRIGVLGVGFDYTHFIDEYIAEDKKGFTTMILNPQGAIIAHKEKRYVNYHSEVMDSTQWITLASLADKGHNESELHRYLEDLSGQKVPTTSFDLYLDGHHYIASATYLPELKWINLSMVDLNNVFGPKEMGMIVLIYVILTFVSWMSLYWIIQRYLVKPIQAISEMTNKIAKGEYNTRVDCNLKRGDEIGQLCLDINEMAVQISESAKHVEKEYRWLAENTSDVIWVMELDGSFTYISPSVEKLRGYTSEEVIRQKVNEAVCAGSHEAVQTAMAKAFAEVASAKEPSIMTIVLEQPHKNGSTVWTEARARLILDDQGKPARFIGSTRDVSERIKAEAEIRTLAFYDPLTGLPNRRLLLDRLEQAILTVKRNNTFMGLIYLDLNHFKPLNDRYGHEAGDELLVEVGCRIRACIRATDTAARFGGDEFIVLVSDLGSDKESGIEYTALIVQKIQEELALPYMLKGARYTLSASVGIHVFGNETVDANTVISTADRLMYRDKEARR